MKKLLYALVVIGLAVLCVPWELFAQDTLTIAPIPAGNINTVINGDTLAGGVRAHPLRVYRLRRGTVYQITEPMRVNGNLFMIANDSAGIRPPVLAPAILLDNSSVDHFFEFVGKKGQVKVNNLYMLSQRSDNVWLSWSDCMRISADSVSLRLRGVYFEGFSNVAINPSYWQKSDIQDCVFRNQAHTSSWFGGQVFRGPGTLALDTTKIINNTFFVNSSYLIDIRGYCPLAVFDHNTCVYGMVNPLLIRSAWNYHMRDNIFYSMHGMGGNPDHVINGWFLNYPDTGASGIIQIRGRDSVSYWSKLWGGVTFNGPNAWVDLGHNVTASMLDMTKWVYGVKNNDVFWPTKLFDFYKAWNDTVKAKDSVDVPVVGQASETKMFLTRKLYYPVWITSYGKWTVDSLAPKTSPNMKVEETPLNLDPGFPDSVNKHVDKQINYVWQISAGAIGSVRWTFPDTSLYLPKWPLPEHFNYTNTALQHAGHDGFALGDLNWFPAQKTQWALTGVGDMPETRPEAFELWQNYPNPFNPVTNIAFAVPKQANVTLKVYNLIGQEVATLVNEMKAPGNYRVSFDASRLSSGAYFYRLIAGSFTSVKKMMLVK